MGNKKGEACKHYAACYAQPLLYRLRHEQDQAEAFRRQQEHCMACHMQTYLVLKQFEHILNVTEYVNENYLRVKEKCLRAIDYVKDINVEDVPPSDPPPRQKQSSRSQFATGITSQETEYLIRLLTMVAA